MVVGTSATLFVKHPQWVAEATEGTTPTASPSFTSLGAVKTASIKIGGSFVDVAQLGSEDLITILQGQQEYETSFTLSAVNATGIIARLIGASNYATPSGLINETISIIFSIYLNGTENYIICKGSRIKEGSISMDIGKETEITVSFVHTTITTPNSSHGLTTPTFTSLPSGAVWGWTDGGTTPVSWNSSGILCKKVTINIARNSKPEYTLGNLDPHSSLPHARRISGDFTTLWTNTTLETDFKAGTARTLAIVIKSGTSTITVTGAKITDYSRDGDIGSDEAIIESCTFKGLSVAQA
ncbi:major tail protein [Nitrososphaeria virus YSH_922147]|uniref:Major tail protein n=1 Tax=Nitrososphaeria virus YSH_922147 TaxID=3071323 RepID=A0A976UAR4_9CAUD|nr:major tail protein [Yangshan Harbor Nitrososphaeria virus]UVF62445.1 major tail protein [Nitrososphaeria virus YSH_922147]